MPWDGEPKKMGWKEVGLMLWITTIFIFVGVILQPKEQPRQAAVSLPIQEPDPCVSIIKQSPYNCKVNKSSSELVAGEMIANFDPERNYTDSLAYHPKQVCGYTMFYDKCKNITYGDVLYVIDNKITTTTIRMCVVSNIKCRLKWVDIDHEPGNITVDVSPTNPNTLGYIPCDSWHPNVKCPGGMNCTITCDNLTEVKT